MLLFLVLLSLLLLSNHQVRAFFSSESFSYSATPPLAPPIFSDNNNKEPCKPIILYRTKEVKIPFPVVKEVPVIREVPVFVKQIVKVPYIVHVPVREEKIIEDIVMQPEEDLKSSSNQKPTVVVPDDSPPASPEVVGDESKPNSGDKKLSDVLMESTDKVLQHWNSFKSSSSSSSSTSSSAASPSQTPITSTSSSSAPSTSGSSFSFTDSSKRLGNDLQFDPMFAASSRPSHTIQHVGKRHRGQVTSKSSSRARKNASGAAIGSASLSMAAAGSVAGTKRARSLK